MTTISIKNLIDGPNALTFDDALKVREAIHTAIKNGEKAFLDFKEVTLFGCFLCFLFSEVYEHGNLFRNQETQTDIPDGADQEIQEDDRAKKKEFFQVLARHPLPADPDEILNHIQVDPESDAGRRILRDLETFRNMRLRKQQQDQKEKALEAELCDMLNDVQAAPELTDETTILTEMVKTLFTLIPDKEKALLVLKEKHGKTIENWTANQA